MPWSAVCSKTSKKHLLMSGTEIGYVLGPRRSGEVEGRVRMGSVEWRNSGGVSWRFPLLTGVEMSPERDIVGNVNPRGRIIASYYCIADYVSLWRSRTISHWQI